MGANESAGRAPANHDPPGVPPQCWWARGETGSRWEACAAPATV